MHSSPRASSFFSWLRPLACVTALVACGGSGGGGGGGPGGGEPAGPRPVVTARALATPHELTLDLAGTLEAPERVEIAARVEGAIVSLGAELGDRVERGDTIARITAEDFSARVAQTEAELAQARSELARAEQLVASDLATAEALEQARTKLRVAESQRALAGRQLRDTRVIAPFDGAIAERLVSPGAFVRVGTPLFVLVATSPLRLAIDVPERLAPAVHPGTMVSVGPEGASAVRARVTRVAPVVDPGTRTFRALVEVAAEDDGAALRPGMYVRARIDLGPVDDAVRLPRQAVFEVLGRSRVVEVVDGRAQPREVELVGEQDGFAIVRGVAAGAEVVTRGPGLLAPGAEVRPAAEGSAPREEPAPREAPAAEARAGDAPRERDGT